MHFLEVPFRSDAMFKGTEGLELFQERVPMHDAASAPTHVEEVHNS
jgi:hypothetical protein